jgi:hypothetical protein
MRFSCNCGKSEETGFSLFFAYFARFFVPFWTPQRPSLGHRHLHTNESAGQDFSRRKLERVNAKRGQAGQRGRWILCDARTTTIRHLRHRNGADDSHGSATWGGLQRLTDQKRERGIITSWRPIRFRDGQNRLAGQGINTLTASRFVIKVTGVGHRKKYKKIRERPWVCATFHPNE